MKTDGFVGISRPPARPRPSFFSEIDELSTCNLLYKFRIDSFLTLIHESCPPGRTLAHRHMLLVSQPLYLRELVRRVNV